MKWISVDEFLPGEKFKNELLITRYLNHEGEINYGMALFDEFAYWTHPFVSCELIQEVTHWLIPDKIKEKGN